MRTFAWLRAALLPGLLLSCSPPLPGGCCPTCLCVAPPAVIARPGPLDFGGVAVGQSATLPLTLFASSAVTLTGAQFSGSGDFSLAGPLPASLSAGSSVSLGIVFTPGAAGSRSGSLTVAGAGASPAQVALQGEGVAAGWLCVTPPALDFGLVPIGASDTRQLTFTACGTTDGQLSGAALAGPDQGFSVGAPPAGPIAPGQAATVAVTFSPTVVGDAGASLSYQLCPGCPASLPLPLAGRAVEGLAFSPEPLSFGTFPAGQSRSITVTATNAEAAPLALLSLSLYARGDPAFSLQGVPPLPATLDAGASFTFTVVDSPTAATGPTKNDLTATFTVGASTAPLQEDLFMSGGGS